MADGAVPTFGQGPDGAAPVPAPINLLPLLGMAGQQCQLQDHPIAAGCTAVAVLVDGDDLWTANAGDSKAVMSRGGVALPLSFEHKPDSVVERGRIEAAGGFVSVAGRVNNNLNLSRSLGDLKYKQNKDIAPKDQIITAEPDVSRYTIQSDDEFIIIACDGVWDVMTNQQAVDFVRERLNSTDTKLSEVCEQVFDRCIASNPRETSGLGGDNMTCVIVQLNGQRAESK